METLVLHTKDKKEARLLKELLGKMNVRVVSLSKQDQEDFQFGQLIKSAVAQGEASAKSVEKIFNKWK